MTDRLKKTGRPPAVVERGAVRPEKPTKLPNVAQPRPLSTTVSSADAASKAGGGSAAQARKAQ